MKYVVIFLVCTLIADCLITAETDEAGCDDIARKRSLRARDENITFNTNTIHCKIACLRVELSDPLQR